MLPFMSLDQKLPDQFWTIREAIKEKAPRLYRELKAAERQQAPPAHREAEMADSFNEGKTEIRFQTARKDEPDRIRKTDIAIWELWERNLAV